MKKSKAFFWMLVAIVWMAQTTVEAAISWYTTRASAVAAAQASGKLILMVAGRNTCPNTQFMKTNMCERANIRQVIDPSYICWYAIVDDDPAESDTYAGGLGGYTLPLICVIDPDDSMNYLDRTTNRQSDEAVFRARLLSHLSWDAGYTDIGGGWRRLTWFGDYTPMGGAGWIWHNKHGFLYSPSSNTPQSIWFFANGRGWLYTGNTTNPFLYRASPAAWLWYNGSTNPRWFRNMSSGQWESWNP